MSYAALLIVYCVLCFFWMAYASRPRSQSNRNKFDGQVESEEKDD